MSATCFNVIGLVANLAGVILLFRYGMPFHVPAKGKTFLIAEGPLDEAEIRQERIYSALGWTGLILIVAGTGLQICGQFP